MVFARNILLWTLGTILISCGTRDYSSEIQKIDLLLPEISELKHLSADTIVIEEKSLELANLLGEILSIYNENDDTLKRENALLIAEGQKIVASLNQLNEYYKHTGKAMINSEGQLEALRHDLEHKLLDVNFVKDAMKNEIDAVNEITDHFHRLNTEKDSLFLKYEESFPNLTELLTKINSKH